MSDWLTFEANIEPLIWGKSTYTILRLPECVAEQLATQGAKRVEGEINDHPVNLALTRAPVVDGMFLWAGKSLMDRIGVEPGQRFDIRLRPAADDVVEIPDEVRAALRREGVLDLWETLTPGKRRGLLYKILTAKTEPTRSKRIAALAADIRTGNP